MSARAASEAVAAMLRPDGPRASPLDPLADWPALLECASEHQLLPALWAALTRAGVRPLPSALRTRRPAAPLAVLEDAYRANATRVADLRAQGHEALGALLDAGIPALPIKGLHGLLAEWWVDPAARVMVDIDVLVPEARVDDAATVMAGLGYRSLGTEDPEGIAGHQRPALGRPGREGSLELHTSPLALRRARLLPAADLFTGADLLHVDGRTLSVPNPTHALVLAIGHAQLQDDGARLLRLPLRALADVATMAARGVTGPVDWREVSTRFARLRAAPALAGFAVALQELFGTQLAVSRRGGRPWLAATWWAADHPRIAQAFREAITLPRSLTASRMERLYGAHTLPDRAVARARHLTAGARRRTGRPESGERPGAVRRVG